MNLFEILFLKLLWLAVVSQIDGKRDFEIVLDYANCTINPNYIKSATCYVNKTLKPYRAFFDVQMQRQVTEMKYTFDVMLLKNNRQQYTLINTTYFDGCVFMEGSISGFNLLKIVRDALIKIGTLPAKCPVDKDFHYEFNGILPDPEQFPPYVPEAKFAIHSNVTESKELIIGFEIYGDVVQKSRKWWG